MLRSPNHLIVARKNGRILQNSSIVYNLNFLFWQYNIWSSHKIWRNI